MYTSECMKLYDDEYKQFLRSCLILSPTEDLPLSSQPLVCKCTHILGTDETFHYLDCGLGRAQRTGRHNTIRDFVYSKLCKAFTRQSGAEVAIERVLPYAKGTIRSDIYVQSNVMGLVKHLDLCITNPAAVYNRSVIMTEAETVLDTDFGTATRKKEEAKCFFYGKTVPNIVHAGQFVPVVFEATGSMTGEKARSFFDHLWQSSPLHFKPPYKSFDSLVSQIQYIMAKSNAQLALYHLAISEASDVAVG